MKYIALLALLMSTTAYAEDAPPPPAPVPTETKVAPAPPPSKFILEMDQSDLATLNLCIGELQYKIANPFVLKLQRNLKPAP